MNDEVRWDKARQLASDVMDLFEELLEDKDITIPSTDREGQDEEARIYGSEYYQLEDSIADLLRDNGVRE